MKLRILDVNLTDGTITEFSPPKSYASDFLGGSGLAFRLILDGDLMVESDSPDNPLYFMAGLLTGTPVPTACKGSLVARSPQTGLWSESTVGGYWPQQLRWAGYQGLRITGRSEQPMYLWIDSEGAELLPADDLWGKDTFETSQALRERHGDRVQVAAIGPAGESEVVFASVMIGGSEARAAGRTGMGAVMGGKQLKAIAVLGDQRPPVADRDLLAARNKDVLQRIREHAQGLHDFGTPVSMQTVEFTGDLPIKNWFEGNWEAGAEAISGQRMVADMLDSHYACFSCPIRCGKELHVRTGPHAGTVSHGPEYETCAAFGSMVLNDDLELLVEANDLANRMGLDTISTGALIAFAMECSEKGQIDDDLPWGDRKTLLGLIEDIAYRRGLGDTLALGARGAARRIGGLAPEYVVETKNLEMAYHDPRAFTSMGVSYATSNRGACHLEGLTYYIEGGAYPPERLGLPKEWDRASSDGKSHMTITMQDYLGVFNALGLCKFLLRGQVDPSDVASWMTAVLGEEVTPDDVMETGERLFNLKRMINARLGVSRKDDVLSPRILTHPRPSGGAEGVLPHLGKMLNEYYQIRGWTEEGVPRTETLERLGLLKEGNEHGIA